MPLRIYLYLYIAHEEDKTRQGQETGWNKAGGLAGVQRMEDKTDAQPEARHCRERTNTHTHTHTQQQQQQQQQQYQEEEHLSYKSQSVKSREPAPEFSRCLHTYLYVLSLSFSQTGNERTNKGRRLLRLRTMNQQGLTPPTEP
jgi:hypothetical protein